MKKFILILSLVIIIMIPTKVQAAGEKAVNLNLQNNKQVESLYNYINNIKSKYELLNDLDVKAYIKNIVQGKEGGLSFKKLSKSIGMYALKEVLVSMKLVGMVIIIAIICSLINNLERAFSNENLSGIAYFACYALIIILVAKSFYIGVDIAKEAIKAMADFMTALIPVLLMLIASVGGIAEAAVMDPIIIGILSLFSRIYADFIIPVILMGFVLQFADNISDSFSISNLTQLFNKFVLWAQGIIMTMFIGILTIRGITSKTLDTVTVKTARYAIDNFVPIVGKCLSDAISSVAGYSLLLKNALSTLGLVIIIAIVLYPIVKIFIISMLYKLSAALIEPIGDSKLVKCISSVGDSLILIMSCLISVSVMFFIMLAIIATAGTMAI